MVDKILVYGYKDLAIGRLCIIFSCLTSLALLFVAITNSQQQAIVSNTALTMSAISTLLLVVIHGILGFRKHIALNVNEISNNEIKAIHAAIDELKVCSMTGSEVLVRSVVERMLSTVHGLDDEANYRKTPRYELLHKLVDEYKTANDITGWQLLTYILIDRVKHRISFLLIGFSCLLIKLGGVKLKHIGEEQSAYEFHQEVWTEHLNSIDSIDSRLKFSLYRIVDALFIVYDFGYLKRIIDYTVKKGLYHISFLTSLRFNKQEKTDLKNRDIDSNKSESNVKEF